MPFHRSLLFWFGACGLVFLLWTWWDSMSFESSLHWRSPSKASEFYLHNAGSKLVLNREHLSDNSPPSPPIFDDLPVFGRLFKKNTLLRSPLEGPLDCIPIPGWGYQKTEQKLEISHQPSVFAINQYWEISHWLLIACYLPPWLGLSFWRARRITKRNATLSVTN